MVRKKPLRPDRIRRISGGFSFIPHRFITGGFLSSLGQKEILLYLFLVLVSDRHGLSFYSYDSICTQLQLTLEQYMDARNKLIDRDLIAHDGTLFQVLELPSKPLELPALESEKSDEKENPMARFASKLFKEV